MPLRISENQNNPYEYRFDVIAKELPFIEKDGKIWQKLTLQSKEKHNLAWKTAKGIAALFATIGTFIIGAFLINGIRNLWQEAISGREIIEIEKQLASPEQKKADHVGNTVLKKQTVDASPVNEENKTAKIDLREQEKRAVADPIILPNPVATKETEEDLSTDSDSVSSEDFVEVPEEGETEEEILSKENHQRIIGEIKEKLSANNPFVKDRAFLNVLAEWQKENDPILKKRKAKEIDDVLLRLLDEIERNALDSIKNENFSRENLKQQFDDVTELLYWIDPLRPVKDFSDKLTEVQTMRDALEAVRDRLSINNPLNTNEFIFELIKANKSEYHWDVVNSFIKNSTNLSGDQFQELLETIKTAKLKVDLTALYELKKNLPPNSPFFETKLFFSLTMINSSILINSTRLILNSSYISDDHLKAFIQFIDGSPEKRLEIEADLLDFNQFRARISLENPLATVNMINLLRSNDLYFHHLETLFNETHATFENLDELYEATTLEKNKRIIEDFRNKLR